MAEIRKALPALPWSAPEHVTLSRAERDKFTEPKINFLSIRVLGDAQLGAQAVEAALQLER